MSDIAVQIKEQVFQINFPRYVAGNAVGGAVAWNDVTGKPATFPPSAHTHPISEVVDVLITSPTNDQVLTYETSSGLWKNKTPSGGGGGITNGQSIVNALIFG